MAINRDDLLEMVGAVAQGVAASNPDFLKADNTSGKMDREITAVSKNIVKFARTLVNLSDESLVRPRTRGS